MNDLEALANSAQRINKIKISGIMSEYAKSYKTKYGELFSFSIWVPRKNSRFLLKCVIFDAVKARRAASELKCDQLLLIDGEFDISSYKKDDTFLYSPQVVVSGYARFSTDTLSPSSNSATAPLIEKEHDLNIDPNYDDVPF